MQNLIIKRLTTENDKKALIRIYRSAMSTEPWFEDLSREIIAKRLKGDFSHPCSEQYIAKIKQMPCAAMWWDETNFLLLQEERGKNLALEWQRISQGATTIWFRDLLVAQKWQSLGIGSQMVDCAIQKWREANYEYALLRIHLGGIEDKNIPSNAKAIKLYQKRGFKLIPEISHITQDTSNKRIKMGYMILNLKEV